MSTGPSPHPTRDPAYDERLHVPLRWWVQATMFVGSVWLAFVVALPALVAGAAAGVLALATVALFLGYGGARVRVVGGELHAGGARIPAHLLGPPEALDPAAARLLAGRDADAAAYLLLRPYLKRAVRVPVTDRDDPVPYWLLSTRHPDALAAALLAAGAGDGAGDGRAAPGRVPD